MTSTSSFSGVVIDGLPTPRRYWAVAAVSLATSMSVIDTTLATVALPTISHDLGVTASQSVWVVNAYQIALLVFLLPMGSLGEIAGFKRVSIAGLGIFLLGALCSMMSSSLLELSLSRLVQGMGAAAIVSVSTALLRLIYPASKLGGAIAINGMVTGMAAALGPSVGSLLLTIGPWRWLFGFSIALGLAALAMSVAALPASDRANRKLDFVSAVLNAASLAPIVIGLQTLVHAGNRALGVGEILFGVVSCWFLIRRELSLKTPLVPLDLLRISIFQQTILRMVCCFAAHTMAMVSMPFFLQEHLKFSVAQTGMLISPWALVLVIVAPFAGWLADRYASTLVSVVGLLMLALGLILLALLQPGASFADVIWRVMLAGSGFGLFQIPSLRTLLGAAPRERSGAAGGMFAMSRQIGGALGAVTAALCFASSQADGKSLALLGASAFTLTAAALSSTDFMKSGRRARKSAEYLAMATKNKPTS